MIRLIGNLVGIFRPSTQSNGSSNKDRGGAEALEGIVRFDHIRDLIYEDLSVKDLLALSRVSPQVRRSVADFKLRNHTFSLLSGSGNEGLRYRDCTTCDWTEDHCPACLVPLVRETATINAHKRMLRRAPQVTHLKVAGRLPSGRGAGINRFLHVMQILSLRSSQLTHLDLRLRISDYYEEGDSRSGQKAARFAEFIESLPIFEHVTHLRLGLELGERTLDELADWSLNAWCLLSKFPTLISVDFISFGDYIPRLDHLPHRQLLRHLELDNCQDLTSSHNFFPLLPPPGPESAKFKLVPLNTFPNLTFLRIGNRSCLPSHNGGIDWLGMIESKNKSSLPPLEHLSLELKAQNSDDNLFGWIVRFLMKANKECSKSVQKLSIKTYDMNSSNVLINELATFHRTQVDYTKQDLALNFPELELNRCCTAHLLTTLLYLSGHPKNCRVTSLVWTFDHYYKVEPELKNLPLYPSILNLELKGILCIKSLGGILSRFPSFTALTLNFDIDSIDVSSEDSLQSDSTQHSVPVPALLDLCPDLKNRLTHLTLAMDLGLHDDSSIHSITDMVKDLSCLQQLTLHSLPPEDEPISLDLWQAVRHLTNKSVGLSSLERVIIKVCDTECQVTHYATERIVSDLIGYSLPRDRGLGGWAHNGKGHTSGGSSSPTSQQQSLKMAAKKKIHWKRTGRDEITFLINQTNQSAGKDDQQRQQQGLKALFSIV